MEPTVTEYQYKAFKYDVLSCCYNVMDLGYTITSYWGVESKDHFSWSSSPAELREVCPLSACLLVKQPSPLTFDFKFDAEEWDTHEVCSIAHATGLPDTFISAISLGYTNPNVAWKQLLSDYLDINNDMPQGMPRNVVENEENFRLGIKLGKFFASHFGL